MGLAGLRPDDVVLEVGPGIGSLTLGLIGAAHRVVAVEVDPLLAAELPATIADRAPALTDRLEVVTADALSLRGIRPPGPAVRGVSGGRPPGPAVRGVPGGRPPGSAPRRDSVPGPPPTALVANLPYNVAVPVVLHLLEELPSIDRALVMVQAEVADRMSAAPGSKTYGVPSVKLAWYGTARRAGAVSRTVFWPAPNVDSALVAFARWPDGGSPAEAAGLPGVTREEVFAVVDAAFAQRRKTLRSALASWAGTPGAAEKVLREAGVEPSLRGEAIGIEQYIRIVLAARKARSIIES